MQKPPCRIGWVLEGETRQGYKDVARAGTLSLTLNPILNDLMRQLKRHVYTLSVWLINPD